MEKRRRRQAGVTLIEMLVVVTIIALFAAVVGTRMLRQTDNARKVAAREQIHAFMTALGTYKLNTGTFPTTEQGLQALINRPTGATRWNGPYLNRDRLPEDPWGHPFVYHSPSERPGHEFDLYSLGPTGRPGDAAAIYNN